MSTIYRIQDRKGLVRIDKKESSEVFSAEQEASETTTASPENKKTKVKSSAGTSSYVEIYTPEEFLAVDLKDDDTEEAVQLLSRHQGASVNMLPDCIIGSLAFPNKEDLPAPPLHLGFYLNGQRLIFIDAQNICVNILENLKDLALLPHLSAARILFEFMKHFTEDDSYFLSDIEEDLGDFEDKIVGHHDNVTNQELLILRRQLLRLDHYYQQLTDIASLIGKDEYLVISKEDRRLFRLYAQQLTRLFQRAQYLKDYGMQLRELYRTQIDIQQNKTIQWLTVITTLVVPLTLITSWYGMNFKYMPELERPEAYFVVIGICVALVIVQLIFFKKRKWL